MYRDRCKKSVTQTEYQPYVAAVFDAGYRSTSAHATFIKHFNLTFALDAGFPDAGFFADLGFDAAALALVAAAPVA
jgi:hypothetical protein